MMALRRSGTETEYDEREQLVGDIAAVYAEQDAATKKQKQKKAEQETRGMV